MKRTTWLALAPLFLAACDVPEAATTDDNDPAPMARQLPGRDLSEDPPRVASMRTVPAGAQDRLEVTFREPLPLTLDFLAGDRKVTLRDDGQQGDLAPRDGTYSALVDAPTLAATAVTAEALDPEKVLMVRDLGVVSHYFRAADPCKPPKAGPGQNAAPAEDQKKWSFGYLMGQMVGSTGISPSKFALEWLNQWLKVQTVNGDPLKPIDGNANGIPVAKYIKDTWLKASGSTTTLDMKKAPFRLLAIVNRFDLRGAQAFNSGNGGELRFVFGVLDLNHRETPNGVCVSLTQTPGSVDGAFPSDTNIILEYAVDLKDAAAVKAYAQKWVALNSLTIDSSAYRTALEAITESVVKKGAGTLKARRNGSALNVLRTNESNDNNIWDFREFTIDRTSANTHLLKAVPVANTPAESVNQSDDLSFWASFWAEEIMDDRHKVPLTFQADPSAKVHTYVKTKFQGSHAATSPHTAWAFDGADDVRHHLSLNTCNGCHQDEGINTGLVFHVRGRPWTERAELSPFLIGDGNGNPFIAFDPVSSTQRPFFELARRRQDLADYLNGTIQSALAFRPLKRTH